MLLGGPDHLKQQLGNDLPLGANTFSSNSANALLDIFAHQTNSFLKRSQFNDIATMYGPVLQNILRSGSGSAIAQLKAALYGNTGTPLAIKDVEDITISFTDIAQALRYQQVTQHISPDHDTLLKDILLQAIDKSITRLSPGQQIIYQQTVAANQSSITTLDVLGRALQKFEDECLAQGQKLSQNDKDAIMSISISFKDMVQVARSSGIIPSTEAVQKTLLPNTATTELFNTYATIFGVTTMQSLMMSAKNVSNQIDAMYTFGGESLFMDVLGIDEAELASQHPQYMAVLQDTQASDSDKQLAKLQAIAHMLQQKNISHADTFQLLLDNGGDFSTLPQATQEQYLKFVKELWKQSPAGKDLIDYLSEFAIGDDLVEKYIDGLFSLQNENIAFTASDGSHRMISIQKKPLQSNNTSHNIHTLSQYGLPFSYTMSGDCFDAKDLQDLHAKKNGFRTDAFPQALTLMIGATKLKQLSPDEADHLIQQTQQQINQQVLASNLSGITSIDPAIEDIDWTNEEVLINTSIEDIEQAKRYYKKKIDDLRVALSGINAKEKSKEKALDAVYESLHSKGKIDPTRASQLQQQLATLEKEIADLALQKEGKI